MDHHKSLLLPRWLWERIRCHNALRVRTPALVMGDGGLLVAGETLRLQMRLPSSAWQSPSPAAAALRLCLPPLRR